MKPKEITMERLFNIGNYENIKLSVTMTLEDGEKIDFSPINEVIKREYNKIKANK